MNDINTSLTMRTPRSTRFGELSDDLFTHARCDEDLFWALIEHAPSAIMILRHGQIVYRNQIHEKWFGFSVDGTAAPFLARSAHMDDRDFGQANEQDLCLDEGISGACEMTLRDQDGRRRHLEVTSQVLTYRDSPVTVVTMHDITASPRVEHTFRTREAQGDHATEAAHRALQHEHLGLQDDMKSAHHFEDIVGASPALDQVFQLVEHVASTDATVLITGETGTGKELIVRALHQHSPRRSHPLVKVNCTALSESLIESELFGHEKGAFTGAIARKLGRFELADGGTLFLDEIGELSLEVQAKLLRVLQEGEFERVGGDRTLTSHVRVIAATNRDLKQAVAAGEFRADLFYRLHVFPIHLPPLRDRAEDIPLLTQHFVDKYTRQIGKSIEAIDANTLDRLMAYSWPGNIRELEHLIERAVILAPGTTLTIADALFTASYVPSAATSAPDAQTLSRTSPRLEDVERAHITQTLETTGWVVEGPKGAARILDLHPNTLRGRMRRLGIKRPTAIY